MEYNYEAQEPDELTIRKGDVIKDIKVSNGGWWEGTLKDKRGMFPDNFVKVGHFFVSIQSFNDIVTLSKSCLFRIVLILFCHSSICTIEI